MDLNGEQLRTVVGTIARLYDGDLTLEWTSRDNHPEGDRPAQLTILNPDRLRVATLWLVNYNAVMEALGTTIEDLGFTDLQRPPRRFRVRENAGVLQVCSAQQH